MSKDNGAKEAQYPKLVFKAEMVQLDNGKFDIEFVIKTGHIPTLDGIYQELGYHIMTLRTVEKAKKAAGHNLIQAASSDVLQKLMSRNKGLK